ncbi:MAG: hypothetical protein FWG44_06135 [Oscillospiraceae bacterium]|nr:hypothetical protein [Oscillospiraceae bacterium]
MVKLIPGKRGSGKTKLLIDAIHAAEKASKGNVIAIQIGSSLNHDINHKVRLINIEDYDIKGYDDLHGFIAGLLASDYDCTDIFIDGLLKIVGRDFTLVAKMLDRLVQFSDSACITFTFSADISEIPEEIKKYL